SGMGRRAHQPNKTCVVSLVERGGQGRSFVLDRVTAENLHRKIDEHVVEGSIVVTDDYYGYRKIPPVYGHNSVKHSAKEYLRKERDFKVHTNTVESKFSLLKRGIVGYVSSNIEETSAALLGRVRSPLQSPEKYGRRAHGFRSEISRGQAVDTQT